MKSVKAFRSGAERPMAFMPKTGTWLVSEEQADPGSLTLTISATDNLGAEAPPTPVQTYVCPSGQT